MPARDRKPSVTEERLGAGPEILGLEIRAALRIRLDSADSPSPQVLEHGQEQPPREASPPLRGRDQEAGDGPDGRVAPELVLPHQLRETISLTDLTPAGGFALEIHDISVVFTPIEQRLAELPVLVRGAISPSLPRRCPPGHAMAPAAASGVRMYSVEIRAPALIE